MLLYQSHTINDFIKILRPGTKFILEIGSDIGGEVVSELGQRTGAAVVGINSSSVFPELTTPKDCKSNFTRADGRFLPFPDDSFDAILSVATMEHVNGLDLFMNEIARVLKPEGVFYTDFGPMWSGSNGHHVCAIVGAKEARFWKPGKNPIPDYGHLLMTPDEMRCYLRSGPCSEELIEPIIQWIYFGDDINRCYYEEYLEAFQKSPLIIQKMNLGINRPDGEILAKLRSKYGYNREFGCSSMNVVFRKLPESAIKGRFFKTYFQVKRNFYQWVAGQIMPIRLIVRLLLIPFSFILKLWRVPFKEVR